MLATLRGRIRQVGADHCLLEVNGVGYEVLLPLTALEKLSRTEGEVLLYTYLHHKEDTMALYGFLDPEEKALFTQMITVSGIGPKTALAIPFRALNRPIPTAIRRKTPVPSAGSRDRFEKRTTTDP